MIIGTKDVINNIFMDLYFQVAQSQSDGCVSLEYINWNTRKLREKKLLLYLVKLNSYEKPIS